MRGCQTLRVLKDCSRLAELLSVSLAFGERGGLDLALQSRSTVGSASKNS